MHITLAISPCPNDTFIFDALIHQKINHDLDIKLVFGDISELNQWAAEGRYDCLKVSYHAWAYFSEYYQVLTSGSALGFGVGPLLVSKNKWDLNDVSNYHVAIPGPNTTANFLLKFAYPKITHKTNLLFSEIENAVLDEKVDGGLIIHENRFTFQEKGLQKVLDLGTFWEQQTNMPIPLGGIVAKRTMDDVLQKEINLLVKKSVEYAFENPHESKAFINHHAQEMDPIVQQKHIDLYVNEYSIDLGTAGKAAISYMMEYLFKINSIKKIPSDMFITS